MPQAFFFRSNTLNAICCWIFARKFGLERLRSRWWLSSPRGRFVLLNCSKAGEAADLLGSPPLFWVKEQVATGVFCKPLHFLCYLGCLVSIFNLHSDCLFRIEHVSRKYTVWCEHIILCREPWQVWNVHGSMTLINYRDIFRIYIKQRELRKPLILQNKI